MAENKWILCYDEIPADAFSNRIWKLEIVVQFLVIDAFGPISFVEVKGLVITWLLLWTFQLIKSLNFEPVSAARGVGVYRWKLKQVVGNCDEKKLV